MQFSPVVIIVTSAIHFDHFIPFPPNSERFVLGSRDAYACCVLEDSHDAFISSCIVYVVTSVWTGLDSIIHAAMIC